MDKIKKLQAQIRVLNLKLKADQENPNYPVRNKIKKLKELLQIELDNYHWENFLSQ